LFSGGHGGVAVEMLTRKIITTINSLLSSLGGGTDAPASPLAEEISHGRYDGEFSRYVRGVSS
jgi:hypothetical protein